VRTTATFPYFFVSNSTTAPTEASEALVAKSISVFPLGNVLIPVAAIAGAVAIAANAAVPQIKPRLENEDIVTFHKTLFNFAWLFYY
jgi:hypothetical protein